MADTTCPYPVIVVSVSWIRGMERSKLLSESLCSGLALKKQQRAIRLRFCKSCILFVFHVTDKKKRITGKDKKNTPLFPTVLRKETLKSVAFIYCLVANLLWYVSFSFYTSKDRVHVLKWTYISKSSHRFAIGFMSGLWRGHCRINKLWSKLNRTLAAGWRLLSFKKLSLCSSLEYLVNSNNFSSSTALFLFHPFYHHL